MATEAKKVKISERAVLSRAGEDQADYTEGVKASYKHITSGAEAVWDMFNPADGKTFAEILIAAGIEEGAAKATQGFIAEGFITKAGHAVNKATKGTNASQDVPAALKAFMDNAREGGWTNREGGQEVNAAAVQEAYAEHLRNQGISDATFERVKLGWEGGTKADGTVVPPWPEAKKQAVRANLDVKAIVDRNRAAKSAERAKAARAASGQAAPEPEDLPDL